MPNIYNNRIHFQFETNFFFFLNYLSKSQNLNDKLQSNSLPRSHKPLVSSVSISTSSRSSPTFLNNKKIESTSFYSDNNNSSNELSTSLYNRNRDINSSSLDSRNRSNLKSTQRHSINDIAQETKQRYGSVDTGNLCDLCKKIKFANGSGHTCFNCKSRCCIRCAFKYTTKNKVIYFLFYFIYYLITLIFSFDIAILGLFGMQEKTRHHIKIRSMVIE